MTIATFDTLKFTDQLVEAGVPEAQARAEAMAIRDAFQSSDIATKADINLLKADIDLLKSDIQGEMRLLKWMLALIVGGVTALILQNFFV